MGVTITREPFDSKRSEEIESLMTKISKQFAKAEDEIIKKVANTILGRDFTLEDGKDFQMVMREGVFDRYDFCYKGKRLGHVMRHFMNWNPLEKEYGTQFMGVEFIPDKEFKI